MNCDDCGVSGDRAALHMIAADLGAGAFLKVLCAVCWHRREYRAELEGRKASRDAQNTAQRNSGSNTGCGETPS